MPSHDRGRSGVRGSVSAIAVQFTGAYSYRLIGWSDLWRDYDRPEQASLWRWDRPQIGYHLAHFRSERARKSAGPLALAGALVRRAASTCRHFPLRRSA